MVYSCTIYWLPWRNLVCWCSKWCLGLYGRQLINKPNGALLYFSGQSIRFIQNSWNYLFGYLCCFFNMILAGKKPAWVVEQGGANYCGEVVMKMNVCLRSEFDIIETNFMLTRKLSRWLRALSVFTLVSCQANCNEMCTFLIIFDLTTFLVQFYMLGYTLLTSMYMDNYLFLCPGE